MPVLDDPDAVLPSKRKLTPSQLIMLLLYPAIFLVGLAVGLVVGIRQGEERSSNDNLNQAKVNSSVIPNANTHVNTNTTNANVNVSNAFLNTNALEGGDYLQIDSTTQAQLNQQEEQEKDRVIDQSASVTDIVRQRELINIKYQLKAYYIVHQAYPTTSSAQVHLDRSSNDPLYVALKDFYGGSFNEPIDPEHPTYYYGYVSDGQTFTLTAKLVSKNKIFSVSNS